MLQINVHLIPGCGPLRNLTPHLVIHDQNYRVKNLECTRRQQSYSDPRRKSGIIVFSVYKAAYSTGRNYFSNTLVYPVGARIWDGFCGRVNHSATTHGHPANVGVGRKLIIISFKSDNGLRARSRF